MSCSKISTIEVPISVTWKIPKEKLLDTKKKEKEEYMYDIQSEEFNVEEFPGLSYQMLFGYEKKRFFAVSLCIKMKEKVDIKASVRYNTEKEVSGNSLSGLEMSKTCKCKLGLKLWDQDDKDFAFMVEEKEIQVHKNVISAESSVFDRMIKSGLQESKETKVAIIDFDFEIVEAGLKFCYGINDDKLYNVENGIKLLQFSDKYDIKDLKTSMETFLLSQISQMNACKLANASILGNSIILRRKCFEYLIECNQKKISVADLEILDKDLALELMKALFSRFTM